ncbi:hypothetical protein [Streptomyces sp. NPDC005876]
MRATVRTQPDAKSTRHLYRVASGGVVADGHGAPWARPRHRAGRAVSQ